MATRNRSLASSSRQFQPRLLPIALAAAMALGGQALAAPPVTQLPVVKPGGAQINATVGTATGGANPTLAVTQNASATNRALVEWESFSVGSSAKVNFTQPNAQSILINRVTGNANGIAASEIYGGISANGRVFLVNPTGIAFGPSAQVNVGSLVATTLDLSADMTANNYAGFINGGNINFESTVAPGGTRSVQVFESDNPLVPQIQAGEGGSILLIGRDGVEQSGTISAPRGSITLTSSATATLTPVTTSGFIEIASDTPALRSTGVLIGSGSQTLASGGAIRIGAAAEEGGTRSETITVQGLVSTDSTTGAGGTIDIDAGSDAASKLVLTGATLGASSTVGKGGRITLGGRDIALNDTGPVSVAADGATGGGSIAVGGTGTGSLVVAGNAVVSADATGSGDGGSIAMQAMLNRMVSSSPIGLPRTEFGVLEMYGTLHARGGIDGGSGGSIETSGLAMTTSLTDSTTGLIGAGTVDARARAASGKAGTWTLDPFDVTISTTGPTTTDGAFNPTGPGANIRAADISAALDGGTSVTISTGQAGSGSATGNITVEAGTAIVRSAGTGATSLTLQAHDSIAIGIGSSITVKGAGPMDINLLSDLDGNGSGNISIGGATLATGGGSLLLSGGATPATGFARGNGQIAGVDLNTSSIDTRGSTGAGNVTIRGAGGPGTFESGVVILGTDITANNISVLGTAGAGLGVQISESTLTSAAGTVDLRGIATRIANAGGQAIGLDIGSLSISAGTGSVLLAGRADDAGFALTGSNPAIGLRYSSLSFAGDENSTATITLAGQAANATGGTGVQYHVGESNVIPASTGANVVIGGESGGGTALDLGTLFNPFVLTTGSVNFRPLGVDANGGLTEQSDIAIRIGAGNSGGVPGNEFRVDASWLQPAGENNGGMTAGKGIVVGSAGHVGQITLDDGVLTNHDSVSLTLQNQGNGSAGIVLGGQNSVGTLGLMSSGTVTQTGAITVQTLVIQGSGGNTVTLSNAQNQIGTLAFDPPGALTVVTAGNLVVDAASAASFDAAGAGFSTLAITDSQGGATALLQAAGTITLNRSISMDNEIGRLDIVSPTQVIFGTGATLSAGTRWSVWAPAVTGLAADSGAIRYYGCAFGDTGTCSVSGIALPQTGQQVLLPTQPTINVAATPANGPAGAIPPLTYTVTGLVNGDTTATALTGALATAATPTSPEGSYAITQGTLTSPTGYVITFQGANLVLGAVPMPIGNLDILGVTREALQSRFQSQFESGVYGRNLAQPYICTAASLIRGLSSDDKQADPLAAEWGKVRNQPQLSGCLDVSDGGSCSAF
ncbi:beta strand repeat-containing protein [Rhizobacter sp. P5_C2]